MLQPRGSRQEILRTPALKKMILRNSLIGAAIGLFVGAAGAVVWAQAKTLNDCLISKLAAECTSSLRSADLYMTIPIGASFGAALFALVAYRITDVYLLFTHENRLHKSMRPPATENKELVDRFTRKK